MTTRTLIRKFKSKTPKIWKNIQRVLISIGALSAIIVLYPERFEFLPPWVINLIFGCSLFGAVLTQFTGKDNNEAEINNADNSPV